MYMSQSTSRLYARIRPRDRQRLEELAEAREASITDVLVDLIRRAHVAMLDTPAPYRLTGDEARK
jgi:uncharacterized protein (DUF1778 family)